MKERSDMAREILIGQPETTTFRSRNICRMPRVANHDTIACSEAVYKSAALTLRKLCFDTLKGLLLHAKSYAFANLKLRFRKTNRKPLSGSPLQPTSQRRCARDDTGLDFLRKGLLPHRRCYGLKEKKQKKLYVSKISFTFVKQTNKDKSHEKVFIPYACFGGHYVYVYKLFVRR